MTAIFYSLAFNLVASVLCKSSSQFHIKVIPVIL